MKTLLRLLLVTLVCPMFGQRISLRDLSVSLQELAQHVKFSVVQIFATGYSATEEADSTNTTCCRSKRAPDRASFSAPMGISLRIRIWCEGRGGFRCACRSPS